MMGHTVQYQELFRCISIPTDHEFTGQIIDQTGLYYYNASTLGSLTTTTG